VRINNDSSVSTTRGRTFVPDSPTQQCENEPHGHQRQEDHSENDETSVTLTLPCGDQPQHTQQRQGDDRTDCDTGDCVADSVAEEHAHSTEHGGDQNDHADDPTHHRLASSLTRIDPTLASSICHGQPLTMRMTDTTISNADNTLRITGGENLP
jgi:hypothetical protein